jgi:hypothetical protein
MIKIMKISLVTFIALGMTTLHANQMKKYDVKSGKIEYTLKGSGNIMGMVKIKSVGKKRVIFDDYGVKNLEEESKVEKETTMGETKVKKNHTLVYMNNAVIYRVDFKKKRINRMKNKGAQMAAMFGGGKNLKESGESMMKKMGGKKLGTDKVLGYTCDIWDLMGSKQCMYKGIPLKIETDVMGMKSTEIATKAEFDIDLNKDDFMLPDYAIYEFNMDRMMNGQEPKELDKSKLEELDKKDNAQAKVDTNEGAKAMQGMAAGLAALAKTGYDMKSSKEMTPEQEKVMQDAMMKTMDENGQMASKMKKKMLKNVDQIEFAQKCFGDADTLSDVNRCVDKGNKMFNDDREYYTSWTAKDKKEELQEIKDFKKAIPCIRAAKTMIEIKQCLPHN